MSFGLTNVCEITRNVGDLWPTYNFDNPFAYIILEHFRIVLQKQFSTAKTVFEKSEKEAGAQ